MKVSEVMKTNFDKIDKDQKLSSAINLMRKKKNNTRLIVTQDNKVVGIISFRDIADRLGTFKTDGISPKSMHVSSAMSFPLIAIQPTTEVVDAAKLMIEKRISSLLVMEGEELKGLLTKYDLLKAITGCKKIKVSDLMTKNVIQISGNERVISARNTMLDKKISILPVINDGEILVGIVDDETLADALARFREQIHEKHQSARIQDFYVQGIMKTDPPTVKQNLPLCNVVDIFQETYYKGIFVVDNNDKLVGLITLTDITKAIAEGRT